MPLFKKAVVNGRPPMQLSDFHLRVLRRCRMILIKDLNPVDILDSLTAEDGFKQDVKDSILSLWSPEKQVGAILDHLEMQSDDTFGVFMEILKEQYKQLHRVLEETARTLNETEDDQTRERAAIVGDSVRKLLRHTARRQLQDQSRRESNESPGDYYIDNLRNDSDDAGQYIDCYIIPTRGKLQKEKWIKHVTSIKECEITPAGQAISHTSSEILVLKDLVFKLINRSAIPDAVEQPHPSSSSIYTIKHDRKNNNESVLNTVIKQGTVIENIEKQQVKTEMTRKSESDKSRSCPPPLPPKPDILSLSGKNFIKNPPNLPEPKVESEDLANVEKKKISDTVMPPLPIRKPHLKSDMQNQVKSPKNLLPQSSNSDEVVQENGLVDKGEDSDDDDDDDDDGDDNDDADEEEDAVSLNFDVGIEEDDEPYEQVSPNDPKGQSALGLDTKVRSLVRQFSLSKSVRRPEFSTVQSPASLGSNGVIQVHLPVNEQRNVLENGTNSESMSQLSFNRSSFPMPGDARSLFDYSHYEEIEPRGGSLSSASGLYLDPRSDGSTLDHRSSRWGKNRGGTLSTFRNQLKDFDSPSEKILTKGTLLILKHKDEITVENPEFGNTLLGYDHMGYAYYVPANSVQRYGDPRNEKWFYPIEITAREATLFLSYVYQKGCFVVYRPSRRTDSSPVYCLSVSLGDGDVVHYNIVENVRGDVMIQDHDHSFLNVCDLVEYFCKNQSNLATRLRRPLKEANMPIMPGYHYSSRFEIQRQQLAMSSVVIDKGTFGDYRLAAFKGISVTVSVMKSETSSSNDDDFLEEALVMMKTEHENIIRLLGVSCSARPYYIVMEHIDKGTLKDCLQNNVIPSDNIDSLFAICIQLVAAMHHLESLRFVLHRNLAAKCFFVTADLLVKLGKFDRSRHVLDDNYQANPSEEVLVRWAAPEVLMGSTYSTKSDVWSLGVVFWEVFSQGMCPYSSLGVEQVAVYVSEGGKLDKPPGCAPDLWSMMKSCWKQLPSDRPTFAMLQDKIKGKSSIYYVSPVRSHVSNKTVVTSEMSKHNGAVRTKTKLSNPIKPSSSTTKLEKVQQKVSHDTSKYYGGAAESVRKKRSQSATRGMRDRYSLGEMEAREKRANSAVRRSCERARTPSSDSSSIVSTSVINDSCDDLDRGQKIRKSLKKLIK